MAGYKKAGLILAVIFGFAVFFSGCKSDYAKKKIKEKGIKKKIKEEETIKKEKIKEKIKEAFDEKLPKKPPIDLRMTFGYNPYWISIISNVDSITILSTKINRGDCGGISRIDRKLGFGNSYEFRILPSFCRYVKEISVKTDKGTWNFTFARK
ncbi:hypothetical protein [Helicobacter pylori]|uniref:Lipoprotein n=1 Tax=Helicobacter pylori TaxID=210 RepID=A0AAD1G3B0_HELPX|nr:hypothetical protein HPATCC43504_00238 [Helicobacter pylori]SQJ02321.1 Uncharacterised protein [Helicobacter pylori NCTC 11637 = CCUG 17874 = ATCC 43504 = JCM 12093]